MVKSNFDHLGIIGLLDTQATTFILGVWGHVEEEVVKKLGFFTLFHKNPDTRGVKNSNKWL